MTTYVCPDEILELFDEDETVEEGHEKIAEWVHSLRYQHGDRILIPCVECGYMHEYEPTPEWVH